MQQKSLFAMSLAAVLMLGMAACHEPIYSEQPEYGALKFTTVPASQITLDKQGEIKTSSICNPGDSVTVFMQVAYAGNYITEADYRWTLYVGSDSTITKSVKVIAPHKQNTPPMWTFKAPDAGGSYTMTFKAKYDYSAQTEAGQIYGESQSYTTELNVR